MQIEDNEYGIMKLQFVNKNPPVLEVVNRYGNIAIKALISICKQGQIAGKNIWENQIK